MSWMSWWRRRWCYWVVDACLSHQFKFIRISHRTHEKSLRHWTEESTQSTARCDNGKNAHRSSGEVFFSKSTSNVFIFVYIDVVYMKTTFQLDEIICGWMGECIFTAAGKISPHYDSYAHTRKTNIVISTVHHKSTTIWVNKSHSLTLIEWGSKMSVSVCGVCCCHRFCFLFFSTGARFWTVNVSSVFIAIYCYIALKLIKIDFVLFSSFELYFYILSLWFQPGKRFQFTMILNTLILPIFNHIHSCFGFLCSTPIFSPFSRATCFILNQRVE